MQARARAKKRAKARALKRGYASKRRGGFVERAWGRILSAAHAVCRSVLRVCTKALTGLMGHHMSDC